MTDQPTMDPRLVAGVDLLGRTGALWTQIRWSDDEEPTVWFAVVCHNRGEDGRPRPENQPGTLVHETSAAMNPVQAVLRLCERIVDGGTCKHCERPTGFHEDIDLMPLDEMICWYQWDPELKTFRRGCAGG